MIVVVGSPIAIPLPQGIGAGGLAVAVARSAAAAGAGVQVVGRVGEDAAGDAVLLALAESGVDHVAVLREAGRRTPSGLRRAGETVSPDGPVLGEAVLVDEAGVDVDTEPDPPGLSLDAADLELALRYLPDYRVVIVATDLDPAALATVVAAAGWAGAQLVALVPPGATAPELPAEATALEQPLADPDGAFARVVAAYAVALDQGREPRAAFDEASARAGWAAAPN